MILLLFIHLNHTIYVPKTPTSLSPKMCNISPMGLGNGGTLSPPFTNSGESEEQYKCNVNGGLKLIIKKVIKGGREILVLIFRHMKTLMKFLDKEL